MNKKIIYLLTAAAFLGLSSCSNVDDVIDVGQQSTNGPTSGIIKEQSKIQAYLGTLKVPGAPLETRAEATPEGSEVSTENTMTVYLDIGLLQRNVIKLLTYSMKQ